MPIPPTAGQQFLTAVDDICYERQIPLAQGRQAALAMVSRHLLALAGLADQTDVAAFSPLDREIAELLPRFKWSLSEANPVPGHLSPLLLQALFEASLDEDHRRHRGIVYTPQETVEAVVQAALLEQDRANNGPLRIADPAAGSGAFLVNLAGHPMNCSELVGLEPDPAALDVARTRLQILQATSTVPQPRLHLMEGLAQHSLVPAGPFDMVIGNPPYVRHEERSSLSREFCEMLARSLALPDRDPRIRRITAGRADLYATFFLLALAALRPGGVVAFVTSDSWLDTRFGEDLQAITLELCDRLVIHPECGQRAFRETGVNTVVTVMRRSQGAGPTTLQIATPGGGGQSPPVIDPTPGKWAARYLRAGSAARSLLGHPHMVPLGSVARLTYGNKPGIRPFFVLPQGRARELVDAPYLQPVLASSKEIVRYAVDPAELTNSLFVCPSSLQELRKNGHSRTVEWIAWGAGEVTVHGARHTRSGVPWPEVQSVRNNRPDWYCLSLRPPGDFIVPSLLGSRLFVAHNPAQVNNTNAFFHGAFQRGIDPLLGLGLLNASITYLLFETLGRPRGLGGLNLYGPELRTMPIFAPEVLTEQQRRGVAEAFSQMCTRPILSLDKELGEGLQGQLPADRKALDNYIFDALEWPDDRRSLFYEELLAATRRRLQKGRNER